MDFENQDEESVFRNIWESVRIERDVHYSLFTFGESVLPYFLVLAAAEAGNNVGIVEGEVRVTRPTIITPDTAHPEFRNFFENQIEEGVADFLMARSAGFSHLTFDNRQRVAQKFVSDSVEESVAKLNRQLDVQEEDQVAILSAPADLGGLAVFKYAAERIMSSAPDNVQELRERGFLP